MKLTLAFDVYGTLIDTQGIALQLEELTGNQADLFALTWRNKQLEYSFRHALMKNYVDFSKCISEALDYTCLYFDTKFSNSQKQKLLNLYCALPKFDDTSEALAKLKSLDHQIYAFSNGSKKSVYELLCSAEIDNIFDGIVSADEIQSFKPDPAVYEYLLKTTVSSRENTWLISSNSFDVIGASSAGLKSIWVQRDKKNIYDPWGIEQTITVSTLQDLVPVFSDFNELHRTI